MATEGVLVVDKPRGPTSHDVVDRVRKTLAVRKAGHTGTLDPFATGVLVVCLGKATRLSRFLAEGEKVYRASVRFGFATTTDDSEGEPLAPPRSVRLDPMALRDACQGLTGESLQVPPAYSARRMQGRRLYEMARAGVVVSPPASPVVVFGLEVLAVAQDVAELAVRCSPGTYVRALARDLGEMLGTGAHLVALRRLRSGEFSLEGAVSGDALTADIVHHILSVSALSLKLPAITVNADGVEAVRHGRDISRETALSGFPDAAGAGRVRILDEAGLLLALALPKGFEFRAEGLQVEPTFHPDVVLVD